jgi:branched-chain amino acid transport system ATP-binding protein
VSETHLAVRGATKRFGGLAAVSDVSFEVNQGEAFGIIGPNGAGKTTLLNCLSGALRIDSGEVRLAGERIDGYPTYKLRSRGLSRTFQLAEHFSSFRVDDFVMLGRLEQQSDSAWAAMLRLPSVRRSERSERAIAHEQLDRFGLLAVANARLGDLSYGLQKQIDVVRAVAADPRLLVLDEPTSGVSSSEREGLVEILSTMGDLGMTATRLVVDHDVGFVTRLCTRVLVMHYGKVLAVGATADVLAMPEVREAYLGT